MNLREKRKKYIIQIITKILISFIISIAIFYFFNVKFIAYITVMFIFLSIFLINYKFQKNIQFFLSMSIILITNVIGLGFTKYFVHNTLHKDWLNLTLFIVYISVITIVMIFCYRLKKITIVKENKTLFARRKYDLNRIKDYLESVDIIGVNGIWGSGKSFIISQMENYFKELGEYIFINIDLLSCNLDEIQTILLTEMETALYENKILPTHSIKLKRILSDNLIYRSIYMLFMKDDISYSQALNGFLQEINLLDKTIVIVYEDIDRISNADIVKKIFSISEKLASNNIKIIYQYDEKNLRELNLDRIYLEKYIPYVVNLTPIKFIDILECVLKDEKVNEILLSIEELNHLTSPIYTNYYLKKELSIECISSIKMDNISIRRVKYFIKELKIILEKQNPEHIENYKEIIINFCFIKFFFPELYENFNLEEGLLDTITFKYEEHDYTILELIAMSKLYKEDNSDVNGLSSEQLNEIFKVRRNQENLFLLNLFKYDFEITDMNKIRDYEKIANEKVSNIEKRALNEKKDRLIWNLLCNGKSEYTNFEVAANTLIKEVLSKPKNEQEQCYKNFCNKMFYEKHEKSDNSTVFRFCFPQFISLTQALRASNISEDSWKDFISFYFKYNKTEEIDIDLIQVLNYCSLSSRKVYFYIINKFNKLKIVGNMNADRSYKRFIKKYLGALSSLGYSNTTELWILDVPEGSALEVHQIENIMNHIKRNIVELKNKISIESIQKDLDSIMLFMNKNIEIAKNERNLEQSKLSVNTEMTSSYIHQEEVDRLLKRNKIIDNKEFIKEVEYSYEKGNISACEVGDLMIKIQKN